MRSKMLLFSLPVVFVATSAMAVDVLEEPKAAAETVAGAPSAASPATAIDVSVPSPATNFVKREFSISEKTSDLVVESTQLSLLQETAVQRHERSADLSFGAFAGQTTLKNQQVNMGKTSTPFVFDDLVSVGLDVRKHLSSYFGWGAQVEYQTYKNSMAALHIVPATLYGFGRTPGATKLKVRAVAGAGYSAAYVRQIGTVGRTGGLGGRAAFWEGGFEVPLKSRSEQWTMGLFYSERVAAEGDFDISGRAVKLQGAITL